MSKVPREEFVWPGYEARAYEDSPLPLGDTGQTISAPHMVALMLEELELSNAQSVLEVGTGSGYNAALIAEVVGGEAGGKGEGRVITIELIDALVDFAFSNLSRTGYSNTVEMLQGDGSMGLPPNIERQVYDRITVTAACAYIPQVLKSQLKNNGILLAPVGGPFAQRLIKVKKMQDRVSESFLTWVSFVPLRGLHGSNRNQ